MTIEIVDFPIKHGDFPLPNVSLPEGNRWIENDRKTIPGDPGDPGDARSPAATFSLRSGGKVKESSKLKASKSSLNSLLWLLRYAKICKHKVHKGKLPKLQNQI